MPNRFRATTHLRPGQRDPTGTTGPIARLQLQLRAWQVLQAGEAVMPGLFDAPTELAVRRFQWHAGHVPAALSVSGAFVRRPLQRLAVDGVVGPKTQRVMLEFAQHGWATTGLLVRLRIDLLAHTWANVGFTALLGGHPSIGLCDREFVAAMRALDAQAQQLGLHLFVNQLFRVEVGDGTSGVAAPTSFSSHKIGRGVDLQLGDSPVLAAGSNPRDARDIAAATDGTPLARFREHAKTALAMRYGGDFESVDSPHFDQQILPAGSPTWLMHYYFNQLQYRQALFNPEAIPDAD